MKFRLRKTAPLFSIAIMGSLASTLTSAETVQEMRVRIQRKMAEDNIRFEQRAMAERAAKQKWEEEARLPDSEPTAPLEIDSSITGTTWSLTSSEGGCQDLIFNENGQFNVRGSNGVTGSLIGAWKQIGNAVYIVCGKKTCIGTGRIDGQTMEMKTKYRNNEGQTWETSSKGDSRPELGNCYFRAHTAPLEQRARITTEQINQGIQLNWISDKSGKFETARSTLRKGVNPEAYNVIEKIASAGDARAQYYLGAFNRIEGGRTYGNAVKWYQLAAAQGHPAAENELGFMYFNGLGVTKDYQIARQWYSYADTSGDPDAAFNLGIIYEKGLGVPADVRQAVSYFRKAEARGHSGAADKLDILDVANKKARFAAKKQPTNPDIARMVAARLARFTTRGRLDPVRPDTLIQSLPMLGQVSTVKIIVDDLDCSKNRNSNGVTCNFIVAQEYAGGLVAEISNAFSINRAYSADFIKGAEEWESPQLDARIQAMGKAERAQRTSTGTGDQQHQSDCDIGQFYGNFDGSVGKLGRLMERMNCRY